MGFEFHGKRYRYKNAQLLAIELADEIGLMALQLKDPKVKTHKSPSDYEEWKRKKEYELHSKTIQLEELKLKIRQYKANKYARRYAIQKYWQVDPTNAESLLMACWVYFRERNALDDKGRSLQMVIGQFFNLDLLPPESLETEEQAQT